MDDEPINLTTVTAISLDQLARLGRTPAIREAARKEQERRRHLDQAEDLAAAIDSLCEATEQRNALLNACDRLLRLVEADRQRQYDSALMGVADEIRAAVARSLGHKT